MKHNSEALKTLAHNLAQKSWRMSNLYFCKDENGKEFKFICNEAQSELIEETHSLNIILKARQLGITTFYCINFLDDCLFNSNITAVLIGDDLEDAKKLLRDKVRYAYDRLPPEIKEHRSLLTDSTEIMRFSNGSSYSVTTSARSGTVQRLHITEFGKICRKSPEKAEEIMSGSLNTVHQGQQIVIESTAQGASGHFFNLCTVAERRMRMKEELTALDWKFHFFGWWKDRKYQMTSDYYFSNKQDDYFLGLEDEGIKLTRQQQTWYCKKEETQGDLMKQEFPSNSKEAFQKAIVGAYWSKELMKAEQDGRIGRVGIDQHLPVHTAWDLGINDTTCIWFFQKKGFDFMLVDYYEMSEEPLPHYFKILKDKSYNYGNHFAPHDISRRSYYDGKDGLEIAKNFGFRFEKITRAQSKIDSINEARTILSRCWFDQKKCEAGISRLREYRKKFNDKLGCFMDQPLHDINSNGADAFQTFAASVHRLETYSQESGGFVDDYDYEEFLNLSNRSPITGY
jgi:hypothetical protein